MHKMCVPMRPQASRLRMCSRPCETDNAGLCSRLLGKLSGILRRKLCERKAYMYSRMKYVIGAQMHASSHPVWASEPDPSQRERVPVLIREASKSSAKSHEALSPQPQQKEVRVWISSCLG